MSKEIENLIHPVAIGELIKHENQEPKYMFFIPAYQRGYRWGEIEVCALLEDILEFLNNKKLVSERYCLQPIVVKHLGNNRYEVLDGQQRLTTIYILLSRLKKLISKVTLFDLEYETRPNSRLMLHNLNTTIDDSNPDYFYITQAYSIIDKWFESNDEFEFKNALEKFVDFIWYEIKEPNVNPIDVFTRINVGKIPLTNSELVKAVFLSKNNLRIGLEDTEDRSFELMIANKQMQIATEWDLMEKHLHNNEFWFFIFNGNQNKYDTRIDYLLDLFTQKKENESNPYYSFQKFYKKVQDARLDEDKIRQQRDLNMSFVEFEWDNIRQYFDIMYEWYNNKTFNHLIGFLILTSNKDNSYLFTLLDSYKNNNRKDFLNIVIDEIDNRVNTKSLKDLDFMNKSDYKTIYNVLVLHNIINALIQPDTSNHFSFDKIKDHKKWSIEHIYAQNSEDIREQDQITWLQEHKDYFQSRPIDAEDFILKIENMLASVKIERNNFLTLFHEINDHVQKNVKKINSEIGISEDDDDGWMNNEHALPNLALLDSSTNSALSNSLFGLKREKIKLKDRELVYIPNETRKVFLKYYSNTNTHDAYWTFADKKAYFASIKNSLRQLNQLKK
jgi:hypothetical protein